MPSRTLARMVVTVVAAAAFVGVTAPVTVSVAAAQPRVFDTFYDYDGSAPLSSYAPGDVLKTRTVPYHVVNVPTPLQAVQVLYRSTDALGRPVANVTSILRPPNAQPGKVLSYQSVYDSLNPDDSPSRAIAGNTPIGQWTPSGRNFNLGGTMVSGEIAMFGPMLAAGYTVVIPDTEGPEADFAAGPEYGMLTLDSLRAAREVAETGITDDAEIALMGYSGGAIATNWAAILAPDYAPDVDDDLIGAAEAGVMVNPATNLRYANGSLGWGGVVGMAIVGIGRAYDIDFDPYLNDYGREIMARMQDASIVNAGAQYPGLTWQQMVKPEYADPNSVPEFVDVVNTINMGIAPIPTIPMFIAQAANGIFNGTLPGGPGTGPGDGVMVADDVAALATRYCNAGLAIQYDQYDTIEHLIGGALWLPGALQWLVDRFNGAPAPSNCGKFAPGNSLAPQTLVAPGHPASVSPTGSGSVS
ncbi:lipase family protein [Rhodococcus qingshengii]|uniref:Lipase family protein n=8 Tax=Bacteria TaxID=2 RepID=A0ABV5XQA3_9NOCA|nr:MULTISPECIES: lipase family protein [Rhodococcus]MBP1054574.1 triacylglycerol lipase [Rhodococcus qingshengii]MBW0282494.1 triacylglycerol lipase [Rhodococcus sp. FH8]